MERWLNSVWGLRYQWINQVELFEYMVWRLGRWSRQEAIDLRVVRILR